MKRAPEAIPRRSTLRKRFIETVFDSEQQAMLLEELRWKVLFALKGNEVGIGFDASRSWRNSFARTIREHLPHYVIHRTKIDGTTPIGLVARAAVYRLKNSNTLRQFLDGSAPSILCRYITNIQVHEPRYRRSKYVTPHHYAAEFRFFADGKTELSYATICQWPGVYIPTTHKISIITRNGGKVDYGRLADVKWKLFTYEDLNDWSPIEPMSPLWNAQRNRRE